jgi:hypothetical protein
MENQVLQNTDSVDLSVAEINSAFKIVTLGEFFYFCVLFLSSKNENSSDIEILRRLSLCYSEMLLTTFKATRQYNPEDHNPKQKY